MHYTHDGVEVFHSFPEALRFVSLEQGAKFEENQDEVEVFIIGGAEIYREGMQYANKLYITHVDGSFDADTFFPVIGPEWREISKQEHPKDAENEYACTFIEYKKTTN